MRKTFLWAAALLFAGVLSSCCRSGQTQDSTLVVGSYNIWCGVSEEGPNPWRERFERLRDQIRFYEYDLLGMQEVRPEQIAMFRTMEEYDLLGTGREGPGEGEHMTILYRRDRLELLDSATFWLSETPGEISLGWDAAYNRICTWAKFRDKVGGQEFYFFNTHFDHMGEVARVESARLLTAQIAAIAGESSLPVLCTGDFNSLPGSEPIRQMMSSLSCAREVSVAPAYNAAVTCRGHDVCSDPKVPGVEIDYIFVNEGVQVLKYGVLTDNNSTYYPSDHLALLARVKFL